MGKRVARDYQLVSQFFAENPLIPFGAKITPHKMANLLKLKREGAGGPKQELIDTLKPFCQFNTCQEFKSLVDNLCFEKELKVRAKEAQKLRLLPRHQDYSLLAMLSPETGSVSSRSQRGSLPGEKKSKKKSRKKWSNLKKKTGKSLLLSMGCTLTAPDIPEAVLSEDASSDVKSES